MGNIVRLLTVCPVLIALAGCGGSTSNHASSPPSASASVSVTTQLPSATPVATTAAVPSPPPALTGYEVQHNSLLVIPRDPKASSVYQLQVSCSSGKSVVGGGGSWRLVAGMLTERHLLASEPVGTSGWMVVADTEGAADPKGSFQFRLEVWAICAVVS